MKKVNLYSLTDVNDLSWTLDRALFLLSNSPVNLRLSDLCRATGLIPSTLTRMKNLHMNPQYEPFVNQHMIFTLLKYLLHHFPTLVVCKAKDGTIQVRLYKMYGGKKLASCLPEPDSNLLFKKNAPREGSTRWFLEQLTQEDLPNPSS